MNLLRFAFVSTFLIIGIQLLFSQSEFIERGISGFGAGAKLTSSKEASGFNLHAGYSYKGFLDGKIYYSKLNGGKIQGGVLTPTVVFYPFKQEDSYRVPTLGFSIGYNNYSIKETKTFIVPDTNAITWRSYQKTEETKINAIILGLHAQKQMAYWKVVLFQPILGASLSIKNSGWEFLIRGGVAICARIVNGPLLVLTPSIEHESGVSTFAVSISSIF